MPKVKKGDLYIAQTLHVRRPMENEEGKKVPTIVPIAHGQLVSETDLTDKEIESFMPHGVLRAPTYEELQEMEARKDAKTGAEAQAEVEAERVRLEQEQEIERQRLETEHRTKTEKAKADLAEAQAREREKAAGSGKKK